MASSTCCLCTQNMHPNRSSTHQHLHLQQHQHIDAPTTTTSTTSRRRIRDNLINGGHDRSVEDEEVASLFFHPCGASQSAIPAQELLLDVDVDQQSIDNDDEVSSTVVDLPQIPSFVDIAEAPAAAADDDDDTNIIRPSSQPPTRILCGFDDDDDEGAAAATAELFASNEEEADEQFEKAATPAQSIEIEEANKSIIYIADDYDAFKYTDADLHVFDVSEFLTDSSGTDDVVRFSVKAEETFEEGAVFPECIYIKSEPESPIKEEEEEEQHFQSLDNPYGSLACPTCPLRFIDADSLQRHRPICQPTHPTAPFCIVTSNSSSGGGSRGPAPRRQQQPHLHGCPECPRSFRSETALRQHRSGHSTDALQQLYRCEHCQRAYNRVSTLIAHRRTHGAAKQFQCPLCPRGFHQKGNLRNHIYVHTGARPYQCARCDKAFNQRSNLNYHWQRNHADETTTTTTMMATNAGDEQQQPIAASYEPQQPLAASYEQQQPLFCADAASTTPAIATAAALPDVVQTSSGPSAIEPPMLVKQQPQQPKQPRAHKPPRAPRKKKPQQPNKVNMMMMPIVAHHNNADGSSAINL